MTFVGVEGRRVRISVPTRFMRDWIESQYAERLVSLWTLEASSVEGVDVFVTGDEAEDNDALPAASPAALRETEAQNNISAPLDPRFTFENFIVGKPNELAFAARGASPKRRRLLITRSFSTAVSASVRRT